jgi:hypothetical protein
MSTLEQHTQRLSSIRNALVGLRERLEGLDTDTGAEEGLALDLREDMAVLTQLVQQLTEFMLWGQWENQPAPFAPTQTVFVAPPDVLAVSDVPAPAVQVTPPPDVLKLRNTSEPEAAE